jgi:hypothetical protein
MEFIPGITLPARQTKPTLFFCVKGNDNKNYHPKSVNYG